MIGGMVAGVSIMFWSMSLELESELDSKWSFAKFTYSRGSGQRGAGCLPHGDNEAMHRRSLEQRTR